MIWVTRRSDEVPRSHVHHWSLTPESPGGSAHLPAKWLLLRAVTAPRIDRHNCQPLIRYGSRLNFRATPDACGSPAGSQVARISRQEVAGAGIKKKDTCSPL